MYFGIHNIAYPPQGFPEITPLGRQCPISIKYCGKINTTHHPYLITDYYSYFNQQSKCFFLIKIFKF